MRQHKVSSDYFSILCICHLPSLTFIYFVIIAVICFSITLDYHQLMNVMVYSIILLFICLVRHIVLSKPVHYFKYFKIYYLLTHACFHISVKQYMIQITFIYTVQLLYICIYNFAWSQYLLWKWDYTFVIWCF